MERDVNLLAGELFQQVEALQSENLALSKELRECSPLVNLARLIAHLEGEAEESHRKWRNSQDANHLVATELKQLGIDLDAIEERLAALEKRQG
jgi:hypothetical protein